MHVTKYHQNILMYESTKMCIAKLLFHSNKPFIFWGLEDDSVSSLVTAAVVEAVVRKFRVDIDYYVVLACVASVVNTLHMEAGDTRVVADTYEVNVVGSLHMVQLVRDT